MDEKRFEPYHYEELLPDLDNLVVSYGGGTNSTAMLVGLYERGIKPSLITFADTGGEKPHTYKHITIINNWLLSIGFPQITIVKKNYRGGELADLYSHSINNNMLPSIAYGFKNCSQKFKQEPQAKAKNNFPQFKDAWKQGRKVVSMLGFDADEDRRMRIHEDKKYKFWYPLIEWGWTREDCKEAISRAGLPQAGKSACYYCPSSKKYEIVQLRDNYPELFEEALKLEANADLHSIKGLGRCFNWGEFIDDYDSETDPAIKEKMIKPRNGLMEELPCGCYDG